MIRGIFYIEAQGRVESAVKNSLKELVDQFRKEDKIRVMNENFDEMLKEGDLYSLVVEVDAVFEDFLTYLLAAIKYGPSAILLSDPEKLVVSRMELLKALGEILRITKDFFDEYDIRYEFRDNGEKKRVGLSQDEIEELYEEGALRIKMVVEAKSSSRYKAIKSLLNAFEDDVLVHKLKTKSLSKGKGFDGLVGVELFVYDVKTLFDLIVKHRPVLLRLLEPEEIELDILEIQDIGVDLAGVFFEASHKIALRK